MEEIMMIDIIEIIKGVNIIHIGFNVIDQIGLQPDTIKVDGSIFLGIIFIGIIGGLFTGLGTILCGI